MWHSRENPIVNVDFIASKSYFSATKQGHPHVIDKKMNNIADSM